MTDENCIYLRCMPWCFDIPEIIITIKGINIPVTSDSYHFLCVCVRECVCGENT